MSGVSTLALTLLLTVFFFALLTQRMMLTTDTNTMVPAHTAIVEKHSHQPSVPITLPKETKPLSPPRTAAEEESDIERMIATRYKDDGVKKPPVVRPEDRPGVSRPNLDGRTATEQQSPRELELPLTISKNTPGLPTTSVDSVPRIERAETGTETIHFGKDTSELPRGQSQQQQTAAAVQTPTKTTPKVGGGGGDGKQEIIKLKDKEIADFDYHPPVSPRNGSDIRYEHQMSILRCPNQSKCIVPALQLQRKYKIYLCRHPVRQGVRFYFLVREGLLLHPNVELLSRERMEEADFMLYLPGSAPWHLSECNQTTYANRTIVMDEFDGPTPLFSPPGMDTKALRQTYGPEEMYYYTYFKRSFVKRLDGRLLSYPHLNRKDVFPITYSIAEAYIPNHFRFQRDIEITCTLRGNSHMTTRQRVQEWVAEYGVVNKIDNMISAQVNTETRTTVSLSYFEKMFNTKIIVTVNPANWEGDFRLWESMGTGALVFVDKLDVPYPHEMVHGQHVVYFSNHNKTDLFSKLDYYRSNPLEARRIAINGYLHSMKYHRTVNMIDYVLRTTHHKQCQERGEPTPQYAYTGQFLNVGALAKHLRLKQAQGELIPASQPIAPQPDTSTFIKFNRDSVIPSVIGDMPRSGPIVMNRLRSNTAAVAVPAAVGGDNGGAAPVVSLAAVTAVAETPVVAVEGRGAVADAPPTVVTPDVTPKESSGATTAASKQSGQIDFLDVSDYPSKTQAAAPKKASSAATPATMVTQEHIAFG